MSFTYFLHNIDLIGVPGTCPNWTPSTSEDTLTQIKQSGLGTRTTYMKGARRSGGLLAVKNNQVFAFEAGGNTNYASGELYVSENLGGSWATCTKMNDIVFDALEANYDPTYWPSQLGFSSFQYIGDTLYANLFHEPTRWGTIVSTTDGATWTHEHTMGAKATYATGSHGYARHVHEYCYTLGQGSDDANPLEILIGGRTFADGTTYCYQHGPGVKIVGTGNGGNADQKIIYADESGVVDKEGNCYQIAQLNTGTVYQTAGTTGAIWHTASGDGSKAIDGVSWNGSRWVHSETGSWRTTEAGGQKYNGYYENYGLRTRKWATDLGDNILMPKGSNETEGHASMGLYVRAAGSTPTDVDYSALIVKTDPANEDDLYSFNIYYVRQCRRWAMVYAFENAGVNPTWFYLRVSSEYDPATFSDAVKLNLPSGQRFGMDSTPSGALELDYSWSNGKWVFGTYTINGSSHRQVVCTVDDPFYCPV